MSTQARLRRGSTVQHAAFTGALAEVTVDTDKKTVVVHDGSTLGGTPLATEAAMQAIAAGFNSVPGGRLSLVSGVAVSSSDVAGALNVYYVAVTTSFVPVYDGAKFTPKSIPNSLALGLDSNSSHAGYQQSGKNFDIFAYDVGGGNIGIGSGPAWASDVIRGTGVGTTELQSIKGMMTNKNAISLRIGANAGDVANIAANRATYLGSFRTTADGQVDDTIGKRYLYNAFNQAARKLVRSDPTASWVYSAATLRQARGDASNKVEVLAGLGGVWIDLVNQARYGNATTATVSALVGIGVDQTTSNDADLWAPAYGTSTLFGHPTAKYLGYVPLGLHAYNMLEQGAGSDTQTWYGNLATSRMVGSAYL